MANPFELLLPHPCSHTTAITMSWRSIARNQTTITSASTLVWGMGWYLLCTALLLPISLAGPHLPLFPLRAVPFLCPPLPHLPDLIWRQSRCYAEIEDGWERYLNPELMTTAPFSSSRCWTSRAGARWEQETSENMRRARRWEGDCFECVCTQ